MHTFFQLAACCSFFLASPPSAAAQSFETDYDFQWAPLADYNDTAIPGMTMFSIGGTPHYPGPGDLIRRCYSVDVTQGGKNDTDCQYEATWFSTTQGWRAGNIPKGVDIDKVSWHSAADSSLVADACLSPFYSSSTLTSGAGGSFSLGLLPATAPLPFPTMWQSTYKFAGTTSGMTGPNTLGVDPLSISGGMTWPLLANVLFDVSGPSVAGELHEQYYAGTSNEIPGTGSAFSPPGRGTGGVTNGNSAWGSMPYGTTADLSGAISHTRIISDDLSSTIYCSPAWWGTNGPGSAESNNYLAFATPFLWAENNGSIGSGGPDWTVSTAPVSNVQIWLKDIRSGAQGTANTHWKTGAPGSPSSIFDPTLIYNSVVFFWSDRPATSMLQQPMNWDDGILHLLPPQKDSYSGSVTTSREGSQFLTVNPDLLTYTMLGVPGLTNGTSFSNAESPFYDTAPFGLAAVDEGTFSTNPVVSGISKLSIAGGAPFPILNSPDPTLAGVNLGVGALGMQIRIVAGDVLLEFTEFANGLTLTLQ